MSTSKTETYQLHAWAPEDSFLRTEFNENFSKLDAALAALSTGKCQMAVGSYVGNGTRLAVNVGFAPQVVILVTDAGQVFQPSAVHYRVGGVFVAGMSFPEFWFEGDGFVVKHDEDVGFTTNRKGVTSHYIALR